MKIGVFIGCEYRPLVEYLQSKELTGLEWHFVEHNNWRESACDCYLLSQQESIPMLEIMPRLSSEVRSSGACDVLLKEQGEYWPHNFLGAFISEVLIERCPQLNNQAFAYVTGDGAWARTLIAVLIQMGFSKINWTCIDPDQAQVAAKAIQSAYFGIQLQILNSSDLNLQPNNGSILVNTLSIEEYPEFLVDLTYLNFVQKGGVVVDMPLLPFEKNILNEAKNVDIHVLHGAELAWKWWEYFCWKNSLPLMKDISYDEFESFLKSRPMPS